MYFVYVLKSNIDNRFYKGMTNNLKRRVYEHNLGKINQQNHIDRGSWFIRKNTKPWKKLEKESYFSNLVLEGNI